MARSLEKHVGVTEFKSKCLALIDEVARGKTRRLVLTKRNKPVAVVTRAEADIPDLFGAMRGTVKFVPGVDLTEPTGEIWNAELDEE